MKKHRDLLTVATRYHAQLPQRLRGYLDRRGIDDAVIDFHLIGWNGVRISIPVFNREGALMFFKLARDPDDPIPGPKMIASPGAYAELYGWEEVVGNASPLVICEGEFDRLALVSKHFHAVTSTGGAGVFRQEWADAIATIPEVYVCYDRDAVGCAGALRVGQMIPHAKIVVLPDEVGDHGDVTDFFVRLGASRADFEALLAVAQPASPAVEQLPKRVCRPIESSDRQRIDQIKRNVRVEDVVARYVKLQRSGDVLRGLCPFHEDRAPSLTVYPTTNTFHCFGCRTHGDVISFLRVMETMSFPDALDALENFSIDHGEAKE